MKKLALIVAFVLGSVALGQRPDGGGSTVAGPVCDGQELTVDLAPAEQIKNIGSKIDGMGMCVFSAIEMGALAQGLEAMRGWRDWCAARYPGGGFPGKVDKLLAAWWQHKGITPIPYYQYQGNDPGPVLALIDKTGRMPCLTYGYSPRYGQLIAHMVCAPGYRGQRACVLDNNFVAKRRADGTWDEAIYEWMAPAELCRRSRLRINGQLGAAWIFCWLPPAAPPAAHNIAPKPRPA